MSRAKGDQAELKACEYLLQNNFKIIEQNFYSRFGEIDIIAYKDNVLHFIEVKSALDYESAISNITKTKISRLIKTLEIYLKKNSIKESLYVLDAIIITPQEITMIDNILL